MVGSLERIEQDIAALDKAVEAIAQEFHSAYASYLAVLGQAARQQLIMASYHVCTQGYPERFLQLPYSQREQLQQTLRHLAQQVQEELLAQLHVPIVPDELAASGPESAPATEAAVEPESAPSSLALNQPQQARPLSPMHLAQWREDLDQAIADELRTASHAANRLLQQANILPKKLPEPILEAATKADLSDMGPANTPNLLNVLVEAASDTQADEDVKGPAVMHIVAICLRLSEIEFADPAVAVARNKIRHLLVQLKTLGREYQKKHRERSIAEAQAAWRASWTED